MTFNPELIAKARKGEIAILNDGSVEQLREVIKECWPDDTSAVYADSRFYKKHRDMSGWDANVHPPNLPAHSVKDFFMDTTTHGFTEEKAAELNEQFGPKPRTYRVTRQQMKEIWEIIVVEELRVAIHKMLTYKFRVFENEGELTEEDIALLVAGLQDVPQILRSIFPEYFFIPEGKPVLVRNRNDETWLPRVSAGNGEAYYEANGNGGLCSRNYNQIIPFTKNPPK